MSDGRRPISGGTNDPRRLAGSGASEGRFSRTTSILGGSPDAGGWIIGTFGLSSCKIKKLALLIVN